MDYFSSSHIFHHYNNNVVVTHWHKKIMINVSSCNIGDSVFNCGVGCKSRLENRRHREQRTLRKHYPTWIHGSIRGSSHIHSMVSCEHKLKGNSNPDAESLRFHVFSLPGFYFYQKLCVFSYFLELKQRWMNDFY